MRYTAIFAQVIFLAALAQAEPKPDTVFIRNKDVAATKVVFRRGHKPTLEIWLTPSKSEEIRRARRTNPNVSTPLIDVLTSSAGSPPDHTELPVIYLTLDDLASTLKMAQDLTKRHRDPALRGIHFDER